MVLDKTDGRPTDGRPTDGRPTGFKFSEWRPIGVCDQGGGPPHGGPPHGRPPHGLNKQKAVMFNEKDLAIVTSAHVTRQNWKTHPEIDQLIHRYAKKIAKISHIAKGMKRPIVVNVRLVGMVLNYNKTPDLNQESSEGRVQLFQIEFKDLGKKKSWFWKVLLGILCTSILGLVIYSMLQWSFQSGLSSIRGNTKFCGTKRSSQTYASNLNQAKFAMKDYLGKLPYDYQKSCYFSKGPINLAEQQLISCYLNLQRAESTLHPSPVQVLNKANRCIQHICEKGLSHLQNYCQQLDF